MEMKSNILKIYTNKEFWLEPFLCNDFKTQSMKINLNIKYKEEEKHLLQIKGEDSWNGYGSLKKKTDPLWWLQNNYIDGTNEEEDLDGNPAV